MAKFTDAFGIERTIQLDPLKILQINDKFEINLLDMVNSDLAQRLTQNLPALMNIIGNLAFPELTEQEAATALADDTVIENAVDAYLEAVVEYLPSRVPLTVA